MTHRLSTDGMVVVDDAAGFAVNNGLVIRGTDLAIESGSVPPTPSSHRSDADFSAHSLRGYQDRLSDSFVLKDLHTYARAPRFFDRHRLYHSVPRRFEDGPVERG